jgi:hypothetical protein
MLKIKPILLNTLIAFYVTSIILFTLKSAIENNFEQYYWNGYTGPEVTEILILKDALFKIFWIELIKGYTLLTGIALFIILFFYTGKTKLSFLVGLSFVVFFIITSYSTKKIIIQQYLIIYEHQQVPESEINKPLYKAGEDICEPINKKIMEYDFKYIRYAIDALGKYKYLPATENLKKILENPNTEYYIKGDCIEALTEIDTEESRRVAHIFRNNLDIDKDSVMTSYLRLIDNN